MYSAPHDIALTPSLPAPELQGDDAARRKLYQCTERHAFRTEFAFGEMKPHRRLEPGPPLPSQSFRADPNATTEATAARIDSTA